MNIPRSEKAVGVCVLLLLLASSRFLVGQTQRGQLSSEALDERTLRSVVPITQPAGIALESTVDPEHYFVGPSDVIAVNIWTSPPVGYALTVTPEGTLIIPTVGEMRISDLTLADAKRRIVAEIKRKYISAEATATLITPRPIVVTVAGNVLYPGLYTLTAVDRANRAVEDANKLGKTETRVDFKRVLSEMSTRNIVLKHKDGTLSRVDIPKFLATRKDTWNPFLREGDVVIVPRKDEARNVIGIYGEVNSPGRYEFVEGDSLRGLIEIAHGLTRHALSDSIQFSRLSSDASSLENRVVNAGQVLSGSIQDFPLEPGDRVVVRAKPDLREDYRVAVLGEVVYPGTYPITRNATHLTDVIGQAGGFTSFASLPGAFVTRQRISTSSGSLDSLLSSRGRNSEEDEEYHRLETALSLQREYVKVDFERLFVGRDSTHNILLNSEDTVYVPGAGKTVYVFGQVVTPGHVPFVPGQHVDFYLQKAGGTMGAARTGSIKIVKAKTKQWLEEVETSIEEGDYIWVPKNPERPFTYYLNIVGQTASIVSVAVTIILLVIQINK